jgi:stage III sporulation protein AE
MSVSESGSLESSRAQVGVTLASSVCIFYSLYPIISSLRDSLSLASGFFLRAVPIMSAVLAAGGNVNSASSQALNMNLALTGVNFVLDRVLLPLTAAFFFLAVFDSFSLGSLSSLSRGAHGVFNWILGILCAVIVGGVSLQSILSTASDGVYIRAARQASGTLIPLVGQTVSSAMSLLFGGLAYAKDIVGVSCVAVIVLICISPIVTLLLYRLAFSVCIIILDFTGSSLGTRCLTGFRRALDSALALYSMSIMIYIFEVLVFMKSGVFSFG